ncbi:Kelch repeat-containing protein [Blastococcus goldschmidtiae]|uniref:Galactose oxidase n=1 Tax=Blastococcus goldschmidtiae TaxID=3075546 RepID=A0ABU2K3T2_9ACTN|nr:hypothetical protein [Blastococcus sp. DSM 46792]MDT0274825.1 hypothetical protein [Blastococcus sp. DSM 46792]
METKILRAVLVGALLVAGTAGCSGDADADPAPAPEGGSAEWRRLPDPPLSPRDEAVLVGLGDRVLVVGGWEFYCPPGAGCATPSEPLFPDGALYDASSDSWRRIAPAPFGVRGHGGTTAGLEGTAYLVTRCADGPACGAPPRLLSYRPADDRWADHGAVPGLEYGGRVTPVGSTLVISGGSAPDQFIDVVFDPARSTWTELPDDPLPPVYDRFLVQVEDQLVVAGSPITAPGTEEQPAKTAARFDVAAGRWVALPDAPGPGYELFPTDQGPLLAGSTRGGPNWLLDPSTWTWTEVRESTREDDDVDGVLDRDRATYGLEGALGGPTYATPVVFHSATGDFLTLRPPPGREDVSGGSSTALGRDLVIHGGQRWSGGYDGELVGDAWLWSAPTG